LVPCIFILVFSYLYFWVFLNVSSLTKSLDWSIYRLFIWYLFTHSNPLNSYLLTLPAYLFTLLIFIFIFNIISWKPSKHKKKFNIFLNKIHLKTKKLLYNHALTKLLKYFIQVAAQNWCPLEYLGAEYSLTKMFRQ